jgi:uncharacterized iron-regulated membrane protein
LAALLSKSDLTGWKSARRHGAASQIHFGTINMMGKRVLFCALCLLLCAASALGQDLYELLGVSASATPSQMKRACVAAEQ